MEHHGLTLNGSRLRELTLEYQRESERAGRTCVNLAAGYEAICKRCEGTGVAPLLPDKRAIVVARKTGGLAYTSLPPSSLLPFPDPPNVPTNVCPDCSGKGKGPYPLVLPKGGVNKSLREFMFDHLKLPRIYSPKAKTDAPTLNKSAMEEYLVSLPERSKALTFVRSLLAKRKRDTAISYMAGYQRFWRPWTPPYGIVSDINEIVYGGRDWYVLHPNLNPTGTDTLRWSSSQPNEQNISKQEAKCKRCEGQEPDVSTCLYCQGTGLEFRSLRYCFGPAPGREWWSMDAKNIELRIPFYEAGEEELISLFERPDEPPYYGSNHLLNFHTVYPDLWEQELRVVGIEKVGPSCKKKYASTWYQWCKNGGFAVQYGAVDKADGTGTADRAFHKPGAQSKLKARFKRLEALNLRFVRYAEKFGYVETIPDRTVDPRRGYPVMCTRTERGRIKPTVPLNYHVQSTAMWWMMKAMIRCEAKLEEWRREGFDAYMVMQVHDELVFDFSKSVTHPKGEAEREKQEGKASLFRRSNLWRIHTLQKIMEEGGADIGIPTPVGCEYHEHNWSEGITL